MAILLNVGIPTPEDMTSAGNTKRRKEINDLVLAAGKHLDEHRDPRLPFTLTLPDGSSISDCHELAAMFRFKKWTVTIPDPTKLELVIAWPAA